MCLNIFKNKSRYWEVFYITKTCGDGYYRLEAANEHEAENIVKNRRPDIGYIRYVKEIPWISINDIHKI